MLQHQKRHAPDRDTDPKDESDQIGMKELRAIDQKAEDKESKEQSANGERQGADSFQFGWWYVSSLHYLSERGHPCPPARLSALNFLTFRRSSRRWIALRLRRHL